MSKTRLAFFILCHKAPQQVIRLVERLRDENSSFVVHVDKRAERTVYETLKSFADTFSGQVHLCRQRYRCYWGRFGIVKATLSCVREAVELALPFDRAFLLSGQDYPIKSMASIRKFLDDHAGREFIESFPADEPNLWTDAEGPHNAINRVLHWTISFRSRHIQIQWERRFPFGYRQIDVVVPDEGEPCLRRSFHSGESFFHKILPNSLHP
jgi:hypothetical protein